MKKVLYLSNIEVPYRTVFFNQLAQECELTVLYERRASANRDAKWAGSQQRAYNTQFLEGVNIGNEHSFSMSVLKWVRKGWDTIIVGCYNSKTQMLAMLYMRMAGIPFVINLDGETFIGAGVKGMLKKFFLGGACAYLTAGVRSAQSLRNAMGDVKVFPYYFSSLTDAEVLANAARQAQREDYVLVVSQYLESKGVDVALECARMDNSIKYKFVGMGKRTQLFIDTYGPIPSNVEIIPFLQKEELEQEYCKCRCMLLPTRQECWGLVVNEAASFGTPVVSTWGSGSAVEYLAGTPYEKYLATPGNPASLLSCLKECLNTASDDYSTHLLNKSKTYTINHNVQIYLTLINNK